MNDETEGPLDDARIIALRAVNEKLRAEHAELKERNNSLALEHTKTSMELTVTRRQNEELTAKLARLEERLHRVCEKSDRDEGTIFRYRTTLDILLERIIDIQIQPLVDEIGI